MDDQPKNSPLREDRLERLRSMHDQLRILTEVASDEGLDMVRYLLSWADSEVERLLRIEGAEHSEPGDNELNADRERRYWMKKH